MNDRYLFKAKDKINTTGYEELDWFKGNLIVEQSTGKHFICDLSHFDNGTKLCDVIIEVDPSTICSCTGLKDKNGTLIWENDIVEIDFQYFQIYWDGDVARYMLVQGEETVDDFAGSNFPNVMKVVGNIFDNPGLLEVEHE